MTNVTLSSGAYSSFEVGSGQDVAIQGTTVDSAWVDRDGVLNVTSSGSLGGATVQSGGDILFADGASAQDIVLQSGAFADFGTDVDATDVVVDGGAVVQFPSFVVSAGQDVHLSSSTFSGFQFDGQADVRFESVTVQSDGMLDAAGVSVGAFTVSTGGVLSDFNAFGGDSTDIVAGTVESAQINGLEAAIEVLSGGVARALATISSDVLVLESGAVGRGNFIGAEGNEGASPVGPAEVVSSGAVDRGTTFEALGVVSSGGLAVGDVMADGGLSILAGAMASASIVSLGGALGVSGRAVDSLVENGGLEEAYSGGVDIDGSILSGGALSGAVIHWRLTAQGHAAEAFTLTGSFNPAANVKFAG
jgi:hypothetical protein